MEKVDIKYKILDPDNCVMCGMCMSYCPTYKVNNNESESPRGRISIIYALNNEMLEPSKSALSHINSCTLCLACESVCPANVNFYQLITDARNKYFKNQKYIFRTKTVLTSLLLRNKILKKIIRSLIHALNKKILKNINKMFFTFMDYTQLSNELPNIDSLEFTNDYIGIFSGCGSSIFQTEVVNNCITILKKNNINSSVIKNIECCGSLDYNSGRINKGQQYNKAAITEFNKNKYQKVIGYASGCSSFINRNDQDVNYEDATTYILDILENNKNTNFKATSKNICVHKPCTTVSAAVNFTKLIGLLKTIPSLNVFTFDDHYCCGAGAQNLIHNKINSLKIIDPKIEFIKLNKIELVLTYNIGCSLNFINSINVNNIDKVEVMHPISFLNNRLI